MYRKTLVFTTLLAACQGPPPHDLAARAVWTPGPATGPAGRYNVVLAHHGPSGATWLLSDLPDTWRFDGVAWAPGVPFPRTYFGKGLSSVPSGPLVAFGGYVCSFDCSYSNEVFEFDGQDWRLRAPKGPAPTPRHDHAQTYDPVAQETLIFGGATSSPGVLDQTWGWDGETWHPRPSGPPARALGQLAFHAASGVAVLFGGRYENNSGQESRALGDTWIRRGEVWTEVRTATAPEARWGHAMAYDDAEEVVFLFGGATIEAGRLRYFDDLWRFDPRTGWQRQNSPGPSPRAFAGLAYEGARDQLILFGGQTEEPLNDTWLWINTGTVAARLVLLAGADQTGAVEEALPTSFSVVVQDARGRGVPGVEVRWSSNNGAVTPLLAVSDAQGRVGAQGTCGLIAGQATWRVEAQDVAPLTVSATCQHGPAAGLSLSLAATATAGVPVDVEARIFDALGNLATTYAGTILFSAPTDPAALLPSRPNFAQQQGVLRIPRGIVFGTPGRHEVTILDENGAFRPGRATVEVIAAAAPALELSADRLTVDVQTPISLTARTDPTSKIEVRELPQGATIEQPAPHQLTLRWTPGAGQSGRHEPLFVAQRGEQEVTRRGLIIVRGSYYGCTHNQISGTPWALLLPLLFLRRRRLGLLLFLVSTPTWAQSAGQSAGQGAGQSRPSAAWVGLSATSSVSPRLVGPLSEYIATQLVTAEIYEVTSESDVRALIDHESKKTLFGQNIDPELLNRINQRLGASRVIKGDLDQVGSDWVLNLALLHAQETRLLGRSAARVPVREDPSPLLDAIRPLLIELMAQDPDPQVRLRTQALKDAGWGRKDPFYFHLTARADADLAAPGLGFGVNFALGANFWGISVGAILARPDQPRPLALRAEGRFHPFLWGLLRPYLGLGSTLFFPEASLRGVVGAELIWGHWLFTADFAFEHYPRPAEFRQNNALLVSLGAGWAF